MRNRLLVLALAVVCVFTLGACDVTESGPCNQIGSQHTNKDGQIYTCAKNMDTGKGYWYKGKT